MGEGVTVGATVVLSLVPSAESLRTWPTLIILALANPLYSTSCTQEIPYLSPIWYKFSPACTVCVAGVSEAGSVVVSAAVSSVVSAGVSAVVSSAAASGSVSEVVSAAAGSGVAVGS